MAARQVPTPTHSTPTYEKFRSWPGWPGLMAHSSSTLTIGPNWMADPGMTSLLRWPASGIGMLIRGN